MLSIKRHEIKIYEHEGYEIENEILPKYFVSDSIDEKFRFEYCVSYRHPSLDEWILARGWWNDEGIWTPEGIWNDY